MKKLIKLFGIVALAAIIGFSMIACKDDSGGSNPFVGTWENSSSGAEFTRVVFTDSSWTMTMPNDPEDEPMLGTYTYSGSTAALKYEDETWGTATISGSSMALNVPEWDDYTFNLSKR